MMMLGLALGAFALAGCAHSLGYAGTHPGRIECRGKGSINATGAIAGGAGVGAAGLNGFSVVADCGEGFILQQGPPVPAPGPPR
jgi:hypothetical protein